jgi:hypothetical protein
MQAGHFTTRRARHDAHRERNARLIFAIPRH